jgi:hypothetical protein
MISHDNTIKTAIPLQTKQTGSEPFAASELFTNQVSYQFHVHVLIRTRPKLSPSVVFRESDHRMIDLERELSDKVVIQVLWMTE